MRFSGAIGRLHEQFMRLRHFILLGSAVAIAAVFWIGYPRWPTVPEVEVTTIRGEKIALASLRGTVLLVNFWATDCAVCVQEMPMMADTYRKYRARGFDAVFIAMPHDRPDHVLHFANRNALPFKVALDVQGEINRAFGGVRATPTTFVAGKDGRIVKRILGEPDVGALHALIEAELGRSGR